MQSVQRSFGKLWSKGPGDNAKVSVLLHDFEDADKVLAKVIDGSQAWRDAWVSLLTSQLSIVTEYEGLYDPIVGASDGHGRPQQPTPALQLNRTFKLKEAFGELHAELMEEIGTVEDRVIKPATQARDCLHPIRRTIKKRENKRLDYEKLQEKVTKLQRKPGRTTKEEATLAKAENEMTVAWEEFGVADEHLRQTLPPLVQAAFSLVPPLLSAHVLIQNRLLGLYYTTLHAYCEDHGFPSPPPPMDEVIATWNAAFKPVQGQIESFSFISRGTAGKPMNLGNGGTAPKPPPPVNPHRASSTSLIPSSNGKGERPGRIPSQPFLRRPSPSPQPAPNPRPRPDFLSPTDFTQATILGGGTVERTSPGRTSPSVSSPASTRNDYFGSRRPSTASTVASATSQVSTATSGSFTVNGVAKKKPPPPPPSKPKPKPNLGMKPAEFVVAVYAFPGQGEGDLSFREGDRIKIVKKTGTDQDWWVGELHGARGNFPANYCKPCKTA